MKFTVAIIAMVLTAGLAFLLMLHGNVCLAVIFAAAIPAYVVMLMVIMYSNRKEIKRW